MLYKLLLPGNILVLTWNYSSLLYVSPGIAKCELNMVAAGCSVDRPLGDCKKDDRFSRIDRFHRIMI